MNNSIKNIETLNSIIKINENEITEITEITEKKLERAVFLDIKSIEPHKEKNKTNKCNKLMKKIFKSPQFHFIVVLLVILDCFCVSLELILDVIISNQNKKIGEKANLVKLITLSSFKINTDFINNYLNSLRNSMNCTREIETNIDFNDVLLNKINITENFLNKTEEDSELYALLHSIEAILKYVGLTILSFFVIEILLSIIFIPRDVIKSKWGMFDAFVVIVSFVLDIILLRNRQLLHTVTGLITLFRLWRITRIINGIVMAMEKKSLSKIHRLVKIVDKLQNENVELNKKLSEYEEKKDES